MCLLKEIVLHLKSHTENGTKRIIFNQFVRNLKTDGWEYIQQQTGDDKFVSYQKDYLQYKQKIFFFNNPNSNMQLNIVSKIMLILQNFWILKLFERNLKLRQFDGFVIKTLGVYKGSLETQNMKLY